MSLVEQHRSIEKEEDSPRVEYIEGAYVNAIDFEKETVQTAFRKIVSIKSLTKKEIAHIKKHVLAKIRPKLPKVPKLRRVPRTRLSVQVIIVRGRKQTVYRDLKGKFRKPLRSSSRTPS